MEDAVLQYCSPAQLRFLFVLLIHEGTPALPLWERFSDDLTYDHSGNILGEVSAAAKELALQDIQQLLHEHGKSTEDYALPKVAMLSAEIQAELKYFALHVQNLSALAQANVSLMSHDLLELYNLLHSIIFSPEPPPCSLYFVTGKAGHGKSFVMETLVYAARANGGIAIVMGTTTLSVSGIDRGQTTHYMCHLPVTDDNTNIVSSIPTNSARADLLRAAKFIMWDELPMANIAVFEAVDALLRDVMAVDALFGGKILIGIGDFQQVAPIVKGGGPTATFLASILSSALWHHFMVNVLTEPICNARDPAFADFVNCIGEDTSMQRVQLNDFLQRTQDLSSLSTQLFPDSVLSDPSASVRRASLLHSMWMLTNSMPTSWNTYQPLFVSMIQ
jgi:hypothetical protein